MAGLTRHRDTGHTSITIVGLATVITDVALIPLSVAFFEVSYLVLLSPQILR